MEINLQLENIRPKFSSFFSASSKKKKKRKKKKDFNGRSLFSLHELTLYLPLYVQR